MALNLPYIDRIWRAEGSVTVAERLTADEAFTRLDPLFQTPGTEYAVEGDTLAYTKRNPAAQDKLATFTRGTLRVAEQQDGTSRVFFNVSSTALLLCFLAPLLFLSFAQIMVTVNAWDKAATEAAETGEKKKDEDKAKPVPQLHPLDQMLGAPAPEDPAKKKKDKEKKDKGKFDPTPAYVLAGLFFLIYCVGRVLEPWLLKRTLRAALSAQHGESAAAAGAFAAPQPDAG
ncbi:MAG: hypothetical protein NBV60_00680 [Erythrobacter sp.]|nr:hypothetical protein [Erythrobacter sp.]